eukprot:TRINITY_DN79410_c0_g1_i1.p1 TRINITY_DN79410_c0_g1~~TRINITY_DN79410_c0_g1_i1.p1  ORF type:complete len:516 (-),score=95.25 TRINITY_DN79410_c0_g1_i1:108-1655(-)
MARLQSIEALKSWVESGGPEKQNEKGSNDSGGYPSSGKSKKKKKENSRSSGAISMLMSDNVTVKGSDDNLGFFATQPIEPGQLILGVALSNALDPRSNVVSEPRRAVMQKVADYVRKAAPWRTPLLSGKTDGTIELIVLLTLELLDGETSLWWPYLQTLPSIEHVALPSLWRRLFGNDGATAISFLEGTSVERPVASDEKDLEVLLGPISKESSDESSKLAGLLGCPDPAAASKAFMHAIALVASRSISGIGVLPFIDLANGAPRGLHNATFERTNLAASPDSKESTPCVAIICRTPIKEGEEIIVNYGQYGAAEFLYRYGWIGGGPVLAAPKDSPSEKVAIPVAFVWASLSEEQRQVLAKFNLHKDDLEEDLAGGSPFGMLVSEASKGLFPPCLQQIALIACCEDTEMLRQLSESGKVSGSGGCARSDLGKRIAKWCSDHVKSLAVLPSTTSTSLTSLQTLLAVRIRRGERELLLRWILGLQKAHGLEKELWAGAMQQHLAACKEAENNVREIE